METALGLSDGDTATGVGNAGTTFAAGDELSLTGGVTLTTASDIADYDVGSVASTINIGSDSAFVATLNYGADHTSPAHTAGTQVAGTAQIIVDANQNYNFGQGVSFDTSAAGLANSNQISFNIDSATVVKAELQFDAPGGAQSFSTIETIEDSGTHLGEEGAPTTSGTFSFKGGDLTVAAANLNNGSATFTVSGGVSDEALLMQIGANNGQNFSVGIDDMRASALGISGSTGAAATVANAVFTAGTADVTNSDNSEGENALDVSTFAKATAAIEVIDKAITTVSAERSKLGAFQNRLEHTINNLGTTSENLTASESRIRDVDMAKEMMEFTKNNILSQAAQAMLAQANQQPQGVLQLLR
jgi:flagellin